MLLKHWRYNLEGIGVWKEVVQANRVVTVPGVQMLQVILMVVDYGKASGSYGTSSMPICHSTWEMVSTSYSGKANG